MSQSVAASAESGFTIESSTPKGERDWAAVRADYEAGVLQVGEVRARYSISGTMLYHRMRLEGWRPRQRILRTDRRMLIARMFRVMDVQIIELEKAMPQTGDKETAVLARLVNSLGKLIEIERREGARPEATDTKEMTELQNTLVERIERLKR